jgi:outer membrane protein insertion porin family
MALSFLFFLSGKAEAQEVRRVVLFPLTVIAAGDQQGIQEELHRLLSAEMGKSRFIRVMDREALRPLIQEKVVDQELAAQILTRVNGDYAVYGTATGIGLVMAVHLYVLDARKPGQAASFFFQGRQGNLEALVAGMRDQLVLQLAAGIMVAGVEVKGNRRIEAPAILQVVRTRAGSLFNEARLARDIRAIYGLGFFDDVTAIFTDGPEGRLLTFEVKEKPLLAEIVIQGNRAIRKADIEELLTVKVREPLNREKLREEVEKVRDLYRRKGFLNATVNEEVSGEEGKDVKVTIAIVEGRKLYVRRIDFEGNIFFSDRALRRLISLREWGLFSFITESGLLNEEELRQDTQKIAAHYLNHGFINVQVGDAVITHDERGIYVSIPIVEGRQFKVKKVGISGDELALTRENLLSGLRLREEFYYDRTALLKDLDYLTQAASDEGYAYAEVIPLTEVDEGRQEVSINYQIRKGSLVYVNRINILGNTRTRDKVIRRQIPLGEGELFQSGKMRSSFANLNNLRYFEEVNIQTERGPADNLVDLNVQVKEKPTGMISVGAGYSALDHAVFTAMIAQQNLFGRGQILSVKATLGATSSMYDVSFIEPWLFDIPLWMKIEAWNTLRSYDTYDLGTSGAGLTFGYPVWRQVSASIGYRFTTNDIRNVKDIASSYIKEQAGQRVTSSLSFGLTRDTTDEHIFPSRGSRNSLGIDYTGGVLGGDNAFVRYMLTSAWFVPMPLGTTVSLRGRIGYLAEVGGKDVPVYERFFLGGMNSLRGLRNVGPTDPVTQDFIGGRTMLNANLEYLFPLLKEAGMKGVLFYDTGNSWLSSYHLDDLRHTAGVGVRWYSPIGPLRLEWGHVLDRRTGESPSRWEFTIGMFM